MITPRFIRQLYAKRPYPWLEALLFVLACWFVVGLIWLAGWEFCHAANWIGWERLNGWPL